MRRYVLIIVSIIASTILGVVGNKLAEQLGWPLWTSVVIFAVSLATLVVVSLLLTREEIRPEKPPSTPEQLPVSVPELPVGPPRPPRLDITVFGQEVLKQALLDEVVKGRTVALTALRGLPGVGKTTLALWLANQPQIARVFPHGVLWVSLGQRPDIAAELGHWLMALGLDPTLLKELPDTEARSHRLRTMLDGKECLLVVDDVWQVGHAHPFLKARGDRCAVLVTGRSGEVIAALVGPDRVRRVDPLEDSPALDMLREHAGRKAFERLRAGTDPETGLDAALALVRHLGNLPLALKLAGAEVRRRHRAGLDPGALLPALRAEERRLLELRGPEARALHPAELSLEAVVRISYDALPDDAMRRAFRFLAVFGPKPLDFDLPAILSVWGLDEEQAEPLLMALTDAGLVEVSPPRYSLHQVLHAFALVELREAGEEHKARLAHARHYVQVARIADELYKQGGENLLHGLALFDQEWPHIRAGHAWAAQHAETDEEATRLCSAYPDAAAHCLNLRQHPRERIAWLAAAAEAACRLGDPKAEGAHLGNLGLAYADLGEVRKAIGYYEQALEIAREIGDRRGEGADLGNLGLAYADLGETRKAIGYYEQALEIAREIGDRRGEGADLGNLGLAYADLGEVRKAIGYYEQALEIAREIGDRRGEGNRLGNLGAAYHRLGEVRKAIGYYEQALEIAREIGDRQMEGNNLGNLGLAYADLGEVRKAIGYYEQALEIAREIGDRRGEGNRLGNLGAAYHRLGEVRKAIGYYEQALEIAREIGDRRGEGNDLANMGQAYKRLGDAARARELWEEALRIYEEIEDPHAEWVRGWLGELS
jgi:tetratricopeptide (TPR) repeat protein